MPSVQLIDKGFQRYKKALKDIGEHTVDVGVFDNDELAQIAAWLEFGTEHIPERPAHRICFERNKAKLSKKYAQMVRDVGEGKLSYAQGLQRIGDWYAGKLRDEIQNWTDPPNAPATIAQKGFDDPLIDTGHYVNSINPRVTKKK